MAFFRGFASTALAFAECFVEQYYDVLQVHPEYLYKFYKESSHLIRPDNSGKMTTVKTIDGIKEMIASLEYEDCRADIKSVDADEVSDSKGVIIVITGCLTKKDGVERNFHQTFFLSPSPENKGCFVSSDIFKYFAPPTSAPVNTNGLPTAAIAPAVEDDASNASPVEIGDCRTVVEEKKLLCCFVVANVPHNYKIYALDLCEFGRCEDLEFRSGRRPVLPDPILTIPVLDDPNLGFPHGMCFGFLDGMLYMLGGCVHFTCSVNVYVVDTRAAISTRDIKSCIVQGPPLNATKTREDIVIPLAGKLFVFSKYLCPFKEDSEYLIEVLDTKKLKKKNSCCWSNILLPPSVIEWSKKNPPKPLPYESKSWCNQYQEGLNRRPYKIESYTTVGSSSIVLCLGLCTSHNFDLFVLDAETQLWTRRVDHVLQFPKFLVGGNLLFWDGIWCLEKPLMGGKFELVTDRDPQEGKFPLVTDIDLLEAQLKLVTDYIEDLQNNCDVEILTEALQEDSDQESNCDVEILTEDLQEDSDEENIYDVKILTEGIVLKDSWVLRVDDTTLLVFSYGHSDPRYAFKQRFNVHTPELFRVDMVRVDKTTNEQGNKQIRCKVVKSMAFRFKEFYRQFELASCYFLLKEG